MDTARDQLASFTLDTLPTLDVVTCGALELFAAEPVTVSLPKYKRPLVIGSVGALVAGKIMYAGTAAVFADESNFLSVLQLHPEIDGVVLISASGSKHAVEIAQTLEANFSGATTLLTCNTDAPAKQFFAESDVVVLPKNREPYTNNTSTYMGMILAKQPEDAAAVLQFINDVIEPALPTDWVAYNAFTFIVPTEYAAVCQLIRIKFEEMFEPLVHGRAYSVEEIKHAKTVVPSDSELFVSLGVANEHYGAESNRWQLPLPDSIGPAGVLAIAYYVVGRIQAAHPPYFKDNIAAYAAQATQVFKADIRPIVE